MKTVHSSWRLPGAVALLSLLAACQTVTKPEDARIIAGPSTPIVKNITSFSQTLKCMDDLFLAYGKQNIVITSDGIPDQTGQVSLGSKEIMITTISKMSSKSKAFKFIDIDTTPTSVNVLQDQFSISTEFETPNYYIRGAISQADLGVADDSRGGGFALPLVSLGYSEDQMLALISIDMNMGNLRKREIIPGLHTNNTITVVRASKGGDAEGIIGKGSVFLEISQDRSQGTHQAVRNLIELSLVEVLGKFTKVPYWRCLELDSTDPTVIAQAKEWFDVLDETQRVILTQSALQQTGLYRGPADGRLNRQTRDAINRYKAREGLIADGRIDFDLYYAFLAADLTVIPDVSVTGASANTDQASVSALSGGTRQGSPTGHDPIGLKISPLNANGLDIGVNEPIRFAISVDAPADVYCYYEGSNQPVLRLFPSRFQPDSYVSPGQRIIIPPETPSYNLFANKPGTETIGCIATSKPYSASNMPASLQEGDLTELQANRLYKVINQHQQADSLNSSVKQLQFYAAPGGVPNTAPTPAQKKKRVFN